MHGSTEAELEYFRQQWREEMTARTRGKVTTVQQRGVPAKPQGRDVAATTITAAARRGSTGTTSTVTKREGFSDFATTAAASIEKNSQHEHARRGDSERTGDGEGDVGEDRAGDIWRGGEGGGEAVDGGTCVVEPQTALEHYERAVEKEGLGSLGESVDLYRKAFKMDTDVHERYKNKYYPPAKHEPIAATAARREIPQTNPSHASPTVPNTAHHSLDGLPASVSQLLDSFSALAITGAQEDEGVSLHSAAASQTSSTTAIPPIPSPVTSRRLPCPIATLPEELIAEILIKVAVQDVGNFSRLALVCKRLAYVVMTEERVWRRVALGHEFGFAGMHYRYACNLDGVPLRNDDFGDEIDCESGRVVGNESHHGRAGGCSLHLASMFTTSPTYPTYRQMFRQRPRIRFNGLYISTVNYSRPGAPSTTQLTWNSPVLIVTYYRYLRFYRDGTLLSLLTTADPSEVVPVFHRSNVPGQKKDGNRRRQNHHDALAASNTTAHTHGSHPPTSVMKDVLCGRWYLSGFPEDIEGEVGFDEVGFDDVGNKKQINNVRDGNVHNEAEGIVHVETEGVVPKYTWKMELALTSVARGGPRNNKLAWISYKCYNRLTDDWGDFGLKNDRPFYWSRVKSYGTGL